MQPKRPDSFSVSKFVPADRCLAGLNVLVRGGRGERREEEEEGWHEEDLQKGSKKVTLLPHPQPPSFLH